MTDKLVALAKGGGVIQLQEIVAGRGDTAAARAGGAESRLGAASFPEVVATFMGMSCVLTIGRCPRWESPGRGMRAEKLITVRKFEAGGLFESKVRQQ